MKIILFLIPVVAMLSHASVARAATESFSFNGLSLAVPDGNPAGLANIQTVNSSIVSINSVEISLNLSGTFNGDLYAYLTCSQGSGFSILLNRTGRSSSNVFGYGDQGFNVTLSDAGAADIHIYRNSVTPGAGNPLTGTWQPDGRNTDPNLVTDLSPRSALLNSFNGLAGSGDWTLFVADMSTGDAHILQNWSLSLTGTAVPEPGLWQLFGAGILAMFYRRSRGGA